MFFTIRYLIVPSIDITSSVDKEFATAATLTNCGLLSAFCDIVFYFDSPNNILFSISKTKPLKISSEYFSMPLLNGLEKNNEGVSP